MAEGVLDRIAGVVADGHLHSAVDFTAAGIHSTQLSRAVRAEALVQYARGIYFRSWNDAVEHIDLAAVSLAHPGGVVCLGSARPLHNVSNKDSSSVWYAVDRARVGRQIAVGPSVPVTTVFWPETALAPGVELRTVMGVEVRAIGAARTVIDLLRYRSKLGNEPGTKALMDYLRDAPGPIGRLCNHADELSCRRTVEPCLRFAEEVRETVPRLPAPRA